MPLRLRSQCKCSWGGNLRTEDSVSSEREVSSLLEASWHAIRSKASQKSPLVSMRGKMQRFKPALSSKRSPSAPLPSFLLFPAEIRVKIYRHLLLLDPEAQYYLCPRSLCFVIYHRNATTDDKKDSRLRGLGLHSAILQCCRLINYEATPILYEENQFITFCPQRYHFNAYHHLRKIQVYQLAQFPSLSIKLDGQRRLFGFLVNDFMHFRNVKKLHIEASCTPEELGSLLRGSILDTLSEIPTVTFYNTGNLQGHLIKFDRKLESVLESVYLADEDDGVLNQVNETCKKMYDQVLLDKHPQLAARKTAEYEIQAYVNDILEQKWAVLITLKDMEGLMERRFSSSTDWFDAEMTKL